jgi:hypothetical protein
MCLEPYEGHPKGCPNYGKSDRCPPKAKWWWDVYDETKPIYAIIEQFDLDAHAEKMKLAHPNWTDKQCRCVLYWQAGMRKRLTQKCKEALKDLPGYNYELTPEAMGWNMVAAAKQFGVNLVWPPHTVTKIAVLGFASVSKSLTN